MNKKPITLSKIILCVLIILNVVSFAVTVILESKVGSGNDLFSNRIDYIEELYVGYEGENCKSHIIHTRELGMNADTLVNVIPAKFMPQFYHKEGATCSENCLTVTLPEAIFQGCIPCGVCFPELKENYKE